MDILYNLNFDDLKKNNKKLFVINNLKDVHFSLYFRHANSSLHLYTDSEKRTVSILADTIKKIAFFRETFNLEKIIHLQACVKISVPAANISLENGFIYNFIQDLEPEIQIFKNTMIVWLEDKHTPLRYYIYEDENLGVLTDKDFYIIAFFVDKYSRKSIKKMARERNLVYQDRNMLKIKYSPLEKPNIKELTTMENAHIYISKINELKNVNIPNLLYFGIQKNLINARFLMDCALATIAIKSDPILLEIASLMDKDLYQGIEILSQSIQNPDEIMQEHSAFYNKIWFYLSLAADLKEDSLLD